MSNINNAHGNIAVPLEFRAQEILNCDSMGVVGTIFQADSIESGTFAEAMIYLLVEYANRQCSEKNEEFIAKLAPFLGKSLNHMDYTEASELFAEFEALVKPEK